MATMSSKIASCPATDRKAGGGNGGGCAAPGSFDISQYKDLLAAETVVFPEYNGLGKCTYTRGAKLSESQHISLPRGPPPYQGILSSALDAVGYTPMIRLSRFAAAHGLACEVLAKCEFFNAGGSVKDRIAKRMVEEAEATGEIKPGSTTLIEPTSGNTGVGLALAAAVKGYKMIITLPEKMSNEKLNMMKALGAQILRTPTEAAWDSPDSHIGLALKLRNCIEDSVILDQYKNPANPLAHYETTAVEIVEQCGGKIDMVVVGAGTGGTITGIARKIKEVHPDCIVVGVDPKGSILAEPDSLNDELRDRPYLVEGIGYDFIPTVLDRVVVDEWVKSDDATSFKLARDLIRHEGLLCGGSSGSAMMGVLAKAKKLKAGQRCVVILPDSSRNYMSKFISDDWMIDQGFMSPAAGESQGIWKGKVVGDLQLQKPVTAMGNVLCSEVVQLMDAKGINQIPVVEADGEIVGVVTEGNLANCLVNGKASRSDPISKVMLKKFKTVLAETPLSVVWRFLDMHPFALVVMPGSDSVLSTKQILSAVITRIDLLRLINGA